jgi:predicted nucleic acid-binding Zn ribbon protein
MANYEFECKFDGIFTREFPIGTAPKKVECKICGDLMERKFSSFRPIFKGNGWGGSK